MRGYTLIELVLVILLLGVLALLVEPFIPSSLVSLDAASRKVRMDLLYTQEQAMITAQNHGIVFTAGGSYQVYRGITTNIINDPLKKTLFDEDLSDYQNVQIDSNYQVEFDPKGTPLLGGGGSVTLSNGSDVKGITVTRNTGYVEIQ